eukprot:CAMPEP_0175973138 /NCGR_PEP_ID=MMETSP0108-20121206/42625_1 /TAXON_ID=195067 ORGANISM="Goniomonas pacifica, Strain CCMP1869" /NCGR_SAMPLE_ID=MMETSP0108 /ASSEMBLY_ACC=CAM_ASM_000204 /LENGTH=112 /DNA_ID=CAMNT_0017302547 /DNA_START=249 /DNA_END=583 /DNA_ORIENTATION=-
MSAIHIARLLDRLGPAAIPEADCVAATNNEAARLPVRAELPPVLSSSRWQLACRLPSHHARPRRERQEVTLAAPWHGDAPTPESVRRIAGLRRRLGRCTRPRTVGLVAGGLV